MWSEHDPYEAGLGFTVKLDKGAFLGRDSLARRSGEQVSRRLACLALGESDGLVLGKEPVYADGSPVGFVTSADYGYTLGHCVAYAWLPSELAVEGTSVEIGYFGERRAATVARDPPLDPAVTRMRR